MLKISIVTACYNMAKYIEQTIRSILSQDYENLEYIIIDGGSTDGTQDIIEKYRDSLAFYVSEPDNGMYDAINKGFAHATGDVLAWLNADDVYLPGALHTVNKIFSTFEDVEWINGRNAYLSSDGMITHILPKNAIRTRRDFINGWCRDELLGFAMQEGMFWRKRLMDRVGPLNLAYKYAGDYDLWMRFAEETDIYYVNTPLSVYRRRKDCLSTVQLKGYLEEVRKIHSGKPRYPGLIWRLVPNGNRTLLNILRMLRLRKGNLIYYTYLGDRLKKKHLIGNSSPHTISSLSTLH